MLGSQYAWQFLLAFPMVIAFIAIFVLLFFFYETPKALIMKNNDYQSARKGNLQKFILKKIKTFHIFVLI